MLVNVAVPYSSIPSSPRSQDMAFFAPTRPDFLFTQGPVQITCQPLQRALAVHWSLCRNLLRTPLLTGAAPLRVDNSALLAPPTDGLTPGFYDLHVRVTLSDTQTLEAITTFGWRVMDEPLLPGEPPDFDAFWAQAWSALPDAPRDLRCERVFTLRGEEIGRYNIGHAALPEHYDSEGERFSEVEVYKVDFAAAAGGRVYGWFAKPPGPGPFPAMLVVPGANNVARPIPAEHARHGYAALDVQVHGFPVDLEAEDYTPLPELVYTRPEKYLHYAVYLNALEAARALRHLPGVAPERLSVAGGSQGGRLSVVVSALDSGIKAAVPAITHYAYRAWLRWTERCNRSGDAGSAGFRSSDVVTDARANVEAYFDAANFAPRVRCPVLMNAGLIDGLSSPTGIFSVFRRLTCPKEIVTLPNLGHDWSPAFDRYAWQWLAGVLGE